ncbi:ribosomal protein S18-alanine N-acetyltransferase [Neisseria sp. 83E34]|uniref:ribosomal protein S18-alanine N-acetyltransferase n=1 Tax=Neisseria sp. 83E34 TaxID=1692264 RepID=UPI0006CE622F|nr:ribosomal protein S18-alanine N-acetyltransferase [Neisseria sp. 83E34]KPN71314.1 acetyltransferase [Neisseria sp. 83E34]
MNIRPATAADCRALAAIDSVCNPSPWSEAQFAGALANQHETVLLAEHQGAVLGFIVWHTLFETSELHLIATVPEHRGRGIASAMMAKWFQTGIEEGATHYYLEVRASNVNAQALYLKHGFTHTGRRRDYYSLPGNRREDALIMEKTC